MPFFSKSLSSHLDSDTLFLFSEETNRANSARDNRRGFLGHISKLKNSALAMLLASGLAFCAMATGQPAQFGDAQSILPSSGTPVWVTTDANGNVYYADISNNVVKLTLSSGLYTSTTVASGLNSPRQIAVDASGNVYIADFGGQQLYKVALVSGSYQAPLALLPSGTFAPTGVAVDASKNVFFVEGWSGDTTVRVLPWSGSTYGAAQAVVVSGSTLLNRPYGIALDATGNLFVADYGASQIVKLPYPGTFNGARTQTAIPTSGILTPQDVAVDGSGNLYIADTGNDRVVKETLTAGVYTQSIVPTSGVGYTSSVAVDGSGNLYIADYNNAKLLKESFTGASFGAVAVGTKSAIQTLTFTFNTGGTLGGIAVVTGGITGLDFANNGTGSCTTQAYLANATCTVDVTFTPAYPGLRVGAVLLTNTSGKIIATGYLNGVGQSAQAVFAGAAPTTIFSGSTSYNSSNPFPNGIVVDPAGNVFVASTADKAIYKIAPGGAQSTVITPALLGPSGLALDGAGNLYIADYAGSAVYKVATDGTQTTVTSGALAPGGIAVDAFGAVYIANWAGSVVKETPSGSVYVQALSITLPDSPRGIALDANGNIYIGITDTGPGIVVAEFSPTGSLKATFKHTGFASGVAVDASGVLYVTDPSVGSVYLFASPSSTAVVQYTGLSQPSGIALDSLGNLYIAQQTASAGLVSKVDRSDPPSWNFPTPTTIHTVDSTDGTANSTAALWNIGNQSLNFNTLTYPTDFPENTADSNLCATGTPLNFGASCDVSASFKPTVGGNLNESIVLTDNSLNTVAPHLATQSIAVSGIGLVPNAILSPSSLNFTTTSVFSSSSMTVSLLNNGNGTLIVSSVAIDNLTQGFTINASSTCGTTPISLAAGASCNITVLFSPTSPGNFAANLVLTDNGSTTTQSISLTGNGQALDAFLAPNNLNFTNLPVGVQSPATLVLLDNASNGPVTVYGFSFAGLSSSAFAQTNNCPISPATLAGNSTCSIWVIFTAPSAGSFSATMSASTNAAIGQQTINMTGNSPGAGALLTPSSLTFGNQTVLTSSSPWIETLTNNSNTPLSITSISIPNASASDFSIQSTTCGAILAAGGNCTISILFTPPAAGNFSATLTVIDNAANSPQSIPLTGTGTAAGVPTPPSPGSVGSTGSTQTATIQIPTGFTLGSIAVVTQGTPNLDFNLVAGGSCTVGTTYTSGQSCTVNYSFTPTAPGARLGAIELFNNATPTAALITTTYITGTGSSALGLFSVGTLNSLSTSLNVARGVSVDAAGNVYVSEQNSGVVDKFAAGTWTKTTVATGIQGPSGTAVDGAGNLFFGAYLGSKVYELAVGASTPVVIATGWSPDDVLLVDGAGNLYSSDVNTGALYKIAVGTHTVTTILPGGTLGRIIGMAIDAAGNLYPADFVHNVLYEIPAGTSTAQPIVTGNGLSSPAGVAIDAAGNLYVTNYSGTSNVLKYAAGSYAKTVLATGTASAGIALDGKGNLYSLTDSTLTQDARTVPVALTFPSTALGATSSEQLAGFENDGNAALTISALSATSNFILTTDTTCANGSLVVAGTCNLAVSFAPTALTPLTGAVNIGDNTLNAYTIQSLPLSGTATPGTQTIVFNAPTSPVNYGVSPLYLSATPGASGNPVVFSILSTTGSATGTISGNFLTITGAPGTITIAANEAGNGTYLAAPQVTQTITVNSDPVTLNASCWNASFNYGANYSCTVSVNGGAATPTGSISYVYDSNAPQTVPLSNSSAQFSITLPAVGSHTLVISYLANGNFAAATPSTQSFTVTAAPVYMQLTPSTYYANYGTAFTFTAAVSATGSATPTGTVTFTDSLNGGPSTTLITGVAVVSGQASYSTSALAVGSHGITATFVPTGGNFATASVSQTITVAANSQTISLTGLPYNASYAPGLSYPITATSLSATNTATGLPVTLTVTGPANFGAGTTCIATTPTTCTLHITGAGNIVVYGNQAGNVATGYAAANQAQANLTINTAIQTITFTPVSSPRTYGAAPITLSATASSGLTVTFTVLSGPGSLTGNQLTITGAGTILVAANQAGNANYQNASPVQISIVVNPETPGIVLTSSVNPVLVLNPITLTATITGVAPTAPTGSVNFLVGQTSLGTAQVINGQASLAIFTGTSIVPIGITAIDAVYSGDNNYSPNTSASISEQVNDFTITTPGSVTNPTAPVPVVTAQAGGTATFQLTLTPAVGGTFTAPVQLTLNGLPTNPPYTYTCAVNYVPLTGCLLPAGSGATTVVLTIAIPAVASAVPPTSEFGPGAGRGLAPIALALLLLPFAARMRKMGKRLGQTMMILVLLLTAGGAIVGITGCSQSIVQPYNVTVEARSGVLVHSTNFVLKVN